MRTDRFQGTQRDGRVGDTHNFVTLHHACCVLHGLGIVHLHWVCAFVVLLLTVGVLVVMLAYCRLATMPITEFIADVVHVLSTFCICGGVCEFVVGLIMVCVSVILRACGV